MELYNLVEVFVKKEIEKLFSDPEFTGCTCERCKNDVAALALNRLKPKYVVTEQGEILGKLDIYEPQVQVNILAAVIAANKIVQENKSHN